MQIQVHQNPNLSFTAACRELGIVATATVAGAAIDGVQGAIMSEMLGACAKARREAEQLGATKLDSEPMCGALDNPEG